MRQWIVSALVAASIFIGAVAAAFFIMAAPIFSVSMLATFVFLVVVVGVHDAIYGVKEG